MLAVALLLLTVFVSSSHQQCFSENDYVGYHTTAELYSWTKSRLGFSLSLFKAIDKSRRTPNTVFSPRSIQEALMLAYFGARHETEASLAKVLQIPAKQTKALSWHLYSMERQVYVEKEGLVSIHPMKSANKIFLSSKLSLQRCMEEKFANELDSIDYERDSAKWAKNYINGWVESVTEGQIKDLIDDLSPNQSATLVNAVYFKSKWMSRFNPKKTKNDQFHVNKKDSRPTKMMVKEDVFEHGYSSSLRARMLLLPYEGNRTAMIVVLPDEDLDKMIGSLNLLTLGIITDLKGYQSDRLELVMPKYKHKIKVSLGSALESLGIGNTLTRNADFSGFTGRKEVFFNSVDHETVINVDEEGTTAAAGTAFGTYLSEFNPLDFRCDRPFAYIIFDFLASKVLFMGTFREPESM